MRDRRYKLLGLTPDLLLRVIFLRADDGNTATVVFMDGVPSDCEVTAVHYNAECDIFILRLWHESFEIVPDGHPIPSLNPTIRSQTVILKEYRGREFI